LRHDLIVAIALELQPPTIAITIQQWVAIICWMAAAFGIEVDRETNFLYRVQVFETVEN
jgi:hypothetical protein